MLPPLSLTLLALASLAPPGPQSVKLNGPLAHVEVTGEISFPPRTSPDGQFHVYTADRDADGVFELYSVRTGGKPVRLFAPVPEYFAYTRFALDDTSAYFVRDLDAYGATELVGVPLDGSAPAKALIDSVASFRQSAAGEFVFTRRTSSAPSWAYELFSAPLDGSDPVRLSGPLVAGGSVGTFVLSSNGLVVYEADQETDGRGELFVVPIDGSEAARKLPIPLVAGGSVAVFQLVPDGSRVVYTADQEEPGRYELFSIASDGSGLPRKLNGSLGPGGDVGVIGEAGNASFFAATFVLSFDGRWVVYSARQDDLEPFELFSVPSDGSRAAVTLSTASDGPVFSDRAMTSYDSAWVVYLPYCYQQCQPGVLLVVPIDGSSPARRISGYYPQLSLDSRYLVYMANPDVAGLELYSEPVDGSGQPVKLNAPLPPGGQVAWDWVREEDVVYRAEQEQDGLFELYVAPVAGGTPPKKLAQGPVDSFQPSFTYDGSVPRYFDEVLFLRGAELFSVEIDGTPPVILDELLPSQAVVGDVEGFDVAPAGDLVVYDAREEGDSPDALYAVDPGKPGVRARFASPPATSIVSERFVPDGSRVVFLTSSGLYVFTAERSAARFLTLLAVPIGGWEKATELAGPWLSGDRGTVLDYRLSADASVVVYRADQEERGVVELFAAQRASARSPITSKR